MTMRTTTDPTASSRGNADDELKIRISTEEKELIRCAANINQRTISEWVRSQAIEHAREVIESARLREATVLPSSTFESLLASLDEPGEPNLKLIQAAHKLEDLDLD